MNRNIIKREARLFLSAFSFYTQIPMPLAGITLTGEDLRGSSRYFPVIGWIIGALGGLVFLLAVSLLSMPVAIALSMAATSFATGAMHEDGFSDTLDAFGGAYTRDRIFEIMKDSGTGAYGVVGIVLILLVKFTCLSSFSSGLVFPVLLAGHTVSRFAAISFMYTHTYAQKDHLSKIGAATKKMTFKELSFAGVFGLFPLLFFGPGAFITVLLPVAGIRFLLAVYYQKRIGGYTGDCLGAVQQITEVIVYLSLAAAL